MSAETSSHERLKARSIYEIVREEGETELARPLPSLWWSGLAAGIAISVSLIAKALIAERLPDASWAPLVSNLGYSLGFVVVVLGRLQLFTENTITVILPLASERSMHNLGRVARLWGIVLLANLAGTFTFAFASVVIGLFGAAEVEAFAKIAHHLMDQTPWETLLGGVPAGFMIAAMVWMLPNSQHASFLVIVVVTYFIGIGEFSHVIVGSADAFVLILLGEQSIASALFGFFFPALIGNIIGGTALFALLAYAQVYHEVED